MEANIQHPKNPVLIDRDISQDLSPTNGNKKEIVLFIFCLLGFAALYYWAFQSSTKVSSFKERYSIGCLIATLLYFAYVLVKILRRGNVRPRNPHRYSPFSIYAAHVYNFVFGSIFFSMFFSIFFVWGDKKGMAIAGIILAGILIYITYKFVGYTKIYQDSKKFGEAQVLVNPNPVNSGQAIQIKFSNKSLFKHTNHIDVFLRNMEEFWRIEEIGVDKDGKTKRTVRHYNHMHFEAHKNLPLQGEETVMDFEIPMDRIFKTDYTTNHPFYWELEFTNSETGYYSRFFIEVV